MVLEQQKFEIVGGGNSWGRDLCEIKGTVLSSYWMELWLCHVHQRMLDGNGDKDFVEVSSATGETTWEVLCCGVWECYNLV